MPCQCHSVSIRENINRRSDGSERTDGQPGLPCAGTGLKPLPEQEY